MIMSDSLKKIAYWALVLTLIVAEIGSFFDLLNINPWCYPVYAALLISCIHSPKVLTLCREYAIISESPTDFVDWLQAIHKMWSCSFWTQPQKVVGYHRETHHFSEGKSTKEFTAPQHTRSILPPIHPTKSIAALRGRYFSFSQIKSYVVVQSSKICFRLLTAQPQSVILVLERSRL